MNVDASRNTLITPSSTLILSHFEMRVKYFLENQESIYNSAAYDYVTVVKHDLFTPTRLRAKIRYNQSEQPATVIQTDADTIRVEFDEPQRAITRGQSVVLYDGDVVIGGGIIN